MQTAIAVMYPDKYRMMVEPDHPDIEERGQEGDIIRPLVDKLAQKSPGLVLRPDNPKDQKCYGDREDAIAERLHTVGFGQADLLFGPCLPRLRLRVALAVN